jgi:hypothetical protein
MVFFSLCLISFFPITHAQELSEEFDTFYIMIQIIQRDNDGNLITYLESDIPAAANLELLDILLDSIATDSDPIFISNDLRFQTVTRTTFLSTDASGLLSTVQYFLLDINDNGHLIAQFTHDGMRLNDDEKVEVVWTFVRRV